MYRSDVIGEESERTAFRKAEKKYKIYYDNTKKYEFSVQLYLSSSLLFSFNRRKKVARPVDLSEVVDFKSILERYNCNGELMGGVSVLKCDFDRPIFCLESRPAKEGKVLVLEERLPDNVSSESEINVIQSDTNAPQWKFVEELGGRDASKLVPASVLLRKLRWSTLGLQFDWSKRKCSLIPSSIAALLVRDIATSVSVAIMFLSLKKIPDALCQLAKRMAGPAMPCGEEFQPEAAIVNYFGLGDMLGGHLDDMEKDWSKPIFGLQSYFPARGKSREHPPIAMFLRSGDAVLMAGEARECFHGVPRIFTDAENAEISQLESRFAGEDDLPYLNYIRTSRININIRQVF
ncbi:UNVERIFIED_CONTAM: Alpha-ketoglutarate-dependent dioxygenase alkB [Sesamum angustifolium]|uniref:Alpha-ketoglutarate-dependent dioxygenase alkB n=1 Tax=Sesamum angustifolium TaxID=2727405 RepID=A0AAW2Q9D7_9LAMI